MYATAPVCGELQQAIEHGGTLACSSAARHLGLWTIDDGSVHVWMRGDGHRRRHDHCGCIEHWDAAEAGAAAGPASVPRALRQILLCLGVEAFFVSLESALHHDIISRAGLAWLRTHVNAAGRDALGFARRDSESGLESLLRWRLRGRGLRVRTQVRIVAVGRVDVLIGDRLIIEVDGRENHEAPSLRHKDLMRDANAAAWGFVTLRFDYAMVVHDWELVDAAIMRVVDAGDHLVR